MGFQAIGAHNQLTIYNTSDASKKHSFPAYLETSDIRYVIDSKELPYAPLSFVNSKVHLRTRQTISLKFNVYSTSSAESVSNYQHLDDIIYWIKPIYKRNEWQYIPDPKNNTGLVSISFPGLQKTHKEAKYGDTLTLHLTNFAYSVNKDMGYHSGSIGALVPVAYSLQMDGDILLQFDKTARVTNDAAKPQNVNVFNAETRDTFFKAFQHLAPAHVDEESDFQALSDTKKQAVGSIINDLIKQYPDSEWTYKWEEGLDGTTKAEIDKQKKQIVKIMVSSG